jgi:hypothetical protein
MDSFFPQPTEGVARDVLRTAGFDCSPGDIRAESSTVVFMTAISTAAVAWGSNIECKTTAAVDACYPRTAP